MRAVRAVDGGVRGMIVLMQCEWLALFMVRGATLTARSSLRCARQQARADAACAVRAVDGGVRDMIALMQYVWLLKLLQQSLVSMTRRVAYRKVKMQISLFLIIRLTYVASSLME